MSDTKQETFEKIANEIGDKQHFVTRANFSRDAFLNNEREKIEIVEEMIKSIYERVMYDLIRLQNLGAKELTEEEIEDDMAWREKYGLLWDVERVMKHGFALTLIMKAKE